MARRRSNARKKTEKPAQDAPAPPRLEPAGEVVVSYHPAPPSGPPDKQIHPRRPLPPIPDAPRKKEESKSDKES